MAKFYPLDKRIVIETGAEVMNARKNADLAYSILKETFANVYIQNGGKSYGDNKVQIETTIFFTIRYDSEVDYNCRILYGSDYYKIEFIEPLENNRWMKITTSRNGRRSTI